MGSPENSARRYKVKLSSGRILGPLDLARVRLFIEKKQFVGTELAREYPKGEWKDINSIPEIAELFMAQLQVGMEGKTPTLGPAGYSPILGAPSDGTVGPTVALPGAGGSRPVSLQVVLPTETVEKSSEESQALPPPALDDADKTVVAPIEEEPAKEEYTEIQDAPELSDPDSSEDIEMVPADLQIRSDVSQEKTIVFQRSSSSASSRSLPGKKRLQLKDILKIGVAALLIGYLGYDVLLSEPDPGPSAVRIVPLRPKLPNFVPGKVDPQMSAKYYAEAMRFYVADTVVGYRIAAQKLLLSASLDPGNVKALAMLASTYLNLIDSSNKDANYFSVISKLIDLSRAKAVDLPETVIADVEFYLTANKAEAAENRIVEYTKVHQPFGLEMFYYLALTFYHRGDFLSAAKYLGQIPDEKAFSAKVFYLRGLIAKKLGDSDSALQAFKLALKINPNHARSRLAIAEMMAGQNRLKDGAVHLEFLVTHPALLSPKDLAKAYYLHSQLSGEFRKFDIALGDIERAVRLDKDNQDYQLEFYMLKAKAGESIKQVRQPARMYYFLIEGEKYLRQGKYHDALSEFLQARQAEERSYIPLVKIGDMFLYLHDLSNAKINYKLATERAPTNIDVWSKYIGVLIDSYEWKDAEAAMNRFRKLPVPQSAIDKAAADMYEKQGKYPIAQELYRKAMSRDVIAPGVYIAYAKSLMATKNFKEAPFFFALALRFDPLNLDALIGTAKCIAETESIDRAISMLQDELQKMSAARAEILSAIAELQIQKGDWDSAQQNLNQAMEANPDYANPWKIQGKIYLNNEGTDKKALEKALMAFKSYSDRNASDPSGYMERYKIFVKKSEYQHAGDELDKIFAIYPKYPSLHYMKGYLYWLQGNQKAAIAEYQMELQNNPGSVATMLELGRSYLQMRAYVDALNLFVKAMRLDPKSTEAKHMAGWTQCLMKNYQAGIALLRTALVFDRGNPLIYKRLGVCLHDSGDPAGAAKAFRKYLEMEPDAPDRAEIRRFL